MCPCVPESKIEFWGFGKTGVPGEKPLEARAPYVGWVCCWFSLEREPTTNPAHIWRRKAGIWTHATLEGGKCSHHSEQMKVITVLLRKQTNKNKTKRLVCDDYSSLFATAYIQSKDEESCVKQALLISFDLHCNGKNSFHSHLMNVSEYFKLPDFNPDLLDIAMVKSYVSSVKQEYISNWQNTLQHSQKRQFYRSFKSNHNTSSYLDLTGGAAVGRALVKLRISNHTLRDRAIIIRKGGPKMSFTKGKIR